MGAGQVSGLVAQLVLLIWRLITINYGIDMRIGVANMRWVWADEGVWMCVLLVGSYYEGWKRESRGVHLFGSRAMFRGAVGVRGICLLA